MSVWYYFQLSEKGNRGLENEFFILDNMRTNKRKQQANDL